MIRARSMAESAREQELSSDAATGEKRYIRVSREIKQHGEGPRLTVTGRGRHRDFSCQMIANSGVRVGGVPGR